MDNTGYYVTYKELFDRLYPSSFVSAKMLVVLSNKSGNTFDYVSDGDDLQSGDVITEGAYAVKVIIATATQVTVSDATNITEGTKYAYRVSGYLDEYERLIVGAMQRIDVYTGQWFNKRDLTLSLEGNNTNYLHFPVPIISVDSVKINNQSEVIETEKYHVYNSRTIPDDRRNPKIKLLSNNADIYRYVDRIYNGVFYSGMFNEVVGSFGYLENDGSTPDAIKFVVSKMVMMELTRDLESSGTGTVKREKTDLHEIEYDTSANKGSGLQGQYTGDTDVDRIIQLYKGPVSVGGTSPMFKTIIDFYQDHRVV